VSGEQQKGAVSRINIVCVLKGTFILQGGVIISNSVNWKNIEAAGGAQMTGASHPFFGNQYTNGGYVIGSFKFPEGLTREVGERLAKVAVPNAVPINIGTSPSIHNAAPLKPVVKTGIKNKWIIPALIIATIAAVSGYFAYRKKKKKGIVKIPNIGVCENCGEPLTGAKFVAESDNPYIVCKKCGEKNFARYSNDDSSKNLSGDEEGGENNGQR
jgi:LPXTG-motif cell wall-anchored protein